jgi:hypothetical protein
MLHRTHLKSVSLQLLLIITGVGAAGCASSSKGEKQVQGFIQTRDFLRESQRHVDVTIVTMNRLRASPAEALSVTYRQFKEAVETLEKQGADAKFRAQGMKDQNAEYIRSWQEEMKTIKDPMIKASLEERRNAVSTNFKLLQMYAEDARKAYDPFLSASKQMVQALSIDLSPAAISSLSDAMDRVTADGAALKQKIALMQHALDNMAQGLSAIGL